MSIGDIGNSIEIYEFDTSHGEWPFIKNIEDTLYAVGYTAPSNYGITKSFLVTPSGDISEPASNTLTHHSASTAYHKSCLRPDNNICHAFQTMAGGLQLECIRVAANGEVDQHANNTTQIDSNAIARFNIQYQRGSIVSFAYDYGDGTPYVATGQVAADGEVAVGRIDRLQLNVLLSRHVQCIKVTDDILLVVWLQANTDLRGVTCSIAANGTISATAQSIVQLANLYVNFPDLINMHSDWYICALDSSGHALELCAFQVNSSGIITIPANNTYQVSATAGYYPQLFRITDTMVGIFSADGSNQGHITTVNFTAGDPVVWSGHATKNIGLDYLFPWHVEVIAWNAIVLSYTGLASDGYLETYELQGPPPPQPHHELIMGIGP